MQRFDRIQDPGSVAATESTAGSTGHILMQDAGGKRKPIMLQWYHLVGLALLFLILLIIAIVVTALIAGGKNHPDLDEPEPLKASSVTEKDTASATPETTTEEPQKKNNTPNRLPDTWLPQSYQLTLKTYLPAGDYDFPAEKNFTAEGTLKIQMDCLKATPNVTLNQKLINFTDDNVFLYLENDGESRKSKLQEIMKDDDANQVHFLFEKNCVVGNVYILELKYAAPISGDVLNGLYRSSYKENGKTKWLAVTQMEPTDGRRMVPMFDEPQMKAMFNITIVHPKGTTALSNGKEITEKQPVDGEPKWVSTEFEPSPKMSSYLLAVCVCEFEKREGTTNQGIRFRIWSRPEMFSKTEFALKAGIQGLQFFTDYFNVPFPMPKQDMIALPDFEAGAMENWGLITYRETALLYDKHTYSLSNKQRVAVVIAHELSHQWFGNLVTMEWWDDLWLNEGFASLMEYIGTDNITNNAFQMENQFVTDALQNAMHRDQLATSHPLFVPIERVQDLYSVFDAISYDKGASVLQMVNKVIGRENFKKGLSHYLSTYSYKNAEHNQLWEAFTTVLNRNDVKVKDWNDNTMNVTKFMDSWTLQMGYPVVNVKRNYETGEVTVQQQRFKLDPKAQEKQQYRNPPFNYTWTIPLWYSMGEVSSVGSLQWLTNKQPMTLKQTVPKEKLLLLNSHADGYYRVNYDEHNWRLIIEQLNKDPSVIPAKTRAQLLDDAFTLARANQLQFSTPLNMTAYLKNEQNALGWDVAMSGLMLFDSFFQYTANYGYVKEFIKNKVVGLYNDSFWTVHNETDVLRQRYESLILGYSCYYDHKECLDRAKGLFEEVLNNCDGKQLSDHTCNTISAHLRARVYCTGVEQSNETMWKIMWQKYLIESHQLEKKRLVNAVCCSREPHLLVRLLDEVVAQKNVRKQDVASFMFNVARSKYGPNIIWGYFKRNFGKLYKAFGKSKYSFRYIIRSAVTSRVFNNHYMVKELQSLAEEHQELKQFTAFEIASEKAQTNANWMDKNYEKLSEYFKKQAGSE